MGAPKEVDVPLGKLAEHLHRVEAGSLDGIQIAVGQVPDGLGVAAMVGVLHHQVGGQAVREGAHLAGSAAGRGLAGEREGAVAGAGVAAGEEVDVVDAVVHPRAAVVLVHAHGPQAQHLAALVGEHLGEFLDVLGRHAGDLGGVLQGVGGQARREGVEVDGLHVVHGLADVGLVVAVIGGVAEILGALLELHVVGYEVVIVLVVHDEVVGDGVGDGDVASRAEGDHLVGRGRGARGHGGHVVVAHVPVGELAGRQARVQHGMRLGHVGAPGDKHVGLVDVSVAAGRLVGLEHVHEAHHGAGHAQARVGIDVVGEQPRLPEFGGAVAFHDGLLAAAPERQPALVGLPRVAQLSRHQVEGFLPGGLAQAVGGALGGRIVTDERLGQTILAVEGAGQVVALHAVEAAARAVLRIAGD